MKTIAKEQVAARYSYSPETGHLLWAIDTYNKVRRIGDQAGGLVGNGYLNARIGNQYFGVHRLAWVLMTGEWPQAEIDHINGDRSDNRWANLRLATRQQNSVNLPVRSDNSSGVKGVFWHERIGKWWAYINHHGKRKTLGYFGDFLDAVSARKRAERQTFGEFNRA